MSLQGIHRRRRTVTLSTGVQLELAQLTYGHLAQAEQEALAFYRQQRLTALREAADLMPADKLQAAVDRLVDMEPEELPRREVKNKNGQPMGPTLPYWQWWMATVMQGQLFGVWLAAVGATAAGQRAYTRAELSDLLREADDLLLCVDAVGEMAKEFYGLKKKQPAEPQPQPQPEPAATT